MKITAPDGTRNRTKKKMKAMSKNVRDFGNGLVTRAQSSIFERSFSDVSPDFWIFIALGGNACTLPLDHFWDVVSLESADGRTETLLNVDFRKKPVNFVHHQMCRLVGSS